MHAPRRHTEDRCATPPTSGARAHNLSARSTAAAAPPPQLTPPPLPPPRSGPRNGLPGLKLGSLKLPHEPEIHVARSLAPQKRAARLVEPLSARLPPHLAADKLGVDVHIYGDGEYGEGHD